MERHIFSIKTSLFMILCIVLSAAVLSACHTTDETENASVLCVMPERMAAATTIQVEPPEPMILMKNPIDFDAWWEQDKNVYAYIEIPNTRISYPILQSDDMQPEDYYLEHNLDGSSGYPGCIYTQRLNHKDFNDYNTVMYGHNMNNGTGFHDLHLFRTEDFFKENRYIYIYTPKEILIYEIYGAYIFSDALILTAYDFETEEGFASYLEMVNDYAADQFNHNLEPTVEDKLLTLSTCTNNDRTRLLVQAKLMYRAECPYGETGEVPERLFSEDEK